MGDDKRRRAVRHVSSALRDVVLICRKCSKKLDGGFGPDGDQKLAKALRRQLVLGHDRKSRCESYAVIEVGCLDVCPKGAVVALRAGRPDDWVLIPRGTTMGEVVDHLGLATPSENGLS